MRIQVMSDIHFEAHRDGGAGFIESLDPEGVDVLVIAGDMYPATGRTQEFLRKFKEKYAEVVYVLGNHEFWGNDMNDLLPAVGLMCKVEGVRLLQSGTVVEIGGKRFLGDTMWFPDTENCHWYGDYMPDFSRITSFDPYLANTVFRRFLKRELQQGDIVVTHHLPCFASIHRAYQKAPTNCFYYSPMEDIIDEKKPALWIHGHTHEPADYVYGETRIVCNPHGYPGERRSSSAPFHDKFIVEV